MNLVKYIPLISFILVSFLGIFILIKNPKKETHLIFFFLSMCLSIWLFGTFMMFVNKNNDNLALFWDRFVYIGITLSGTLFYHFGLCFNKAKKGLVLYIGYIISLIFLILSRTRYFVDDLFKYTWGVHSQARLFHHIFLIFFFIYLGLAFYHIYRASKRLSGLEKTQAKYVLFSFIALLIVGAPSFLPAYKIGIYPVSFLGGIFFSVIVTYTIIRYRLMDIRLVVRQITVLGFSLVVSIGLSILLMLLATNLLPFYISSLWIGSLILVVGIIVFQLVKNGFSKFANRHLFLTLYNYEKTLSDLTEKLSETIDLKRLVFLTTETLKDVMKLDRIGLVLKKLELPQGQLRLLNNHHQETEMIKEKKESENFYLAKTINFNKEKIKPLMKNQLLIHYLEVSKEPLIKDELDHLIEDSTDETLKKKMSVLSEYMKKTETSLYLPLSIQDQMIGIFILGKKISGDAYTVQDVSLLQSSARQIAIAINNAQLYEQSQYFNQILRARIVEATKELGQAYRDLKKLDDSKTEFLSLASHQLRTPLSAIKGYLSMTLEGSFGQLKSETKEALKNVYESNERLIDLVNDLLNVTRIEAGKLEYNPIETDFNKLIESVINELKISSEKKGLLLKYSRKNLPKIFIDPNKIRQVLINLIDNAIKYTTKGEVVVKTSIRNNKEIVVEVKDTGIGISPEKMKNLFEWFSRGKGAIKLESGGFGIGLYIAKKIVEKANGKIWAESKGENKGTSFYFSLPID